MSDEQKTLRDEMAMAALIGIISGAVSVNKHIDRFAKLSYLYADEMMKAREGNDE